MQDAVEFGVLAKIAESELQAALPGLIRDYSWEGMKRVIDTFVGAADLAAIDFFSVPSEILASLAQENPQLTEQRNQELLTILYRAIIFSPQNWQEALVEERR